MSHRFQSFSWLSSLSIVLKVSTAFSIVKLMIGLVLVVVGAGLFVIFTGSINAAQLNGAPIGVGSFSDTEWCLIVLGVDLVFLSVAFGGVKLAGLGWRVFGLIVLLAGAAILSIGIWNHVYGPPLDKGPVNDDRFPVPSELNIVVYVLAGLCLLGGLLLTMLRRVKE